MRETGVLETDHGARRWPGLDRCRKEETGMTLLKLPKYVEMPGRVAPVTGCRPGDVAPLVILTNFREHVERCGSLFDAVTWSTDAGWEVRTVIGRYRETPMTVSCAGIGAGQTSNVMEELINLGG